MAGSRTSSYSRIGLISLGFVCLAPMGLNGASPVGNADAVWKKAGADEGLRQAFERAAYALKDSGNGTWSGANAAHRLTLEFNGREARLSHPDGSVNFHLIGYGYGDRLRPPAPATLTGTGNRVEYQRGDLTEWYVNGTQGLEQGFTLAERPGADREGQPLVIALGVSGGLRPVQKTDDGSVQFESGKGIVLRYAGLKALDARGRILPSRLDVRGSEIRLIVEDHGAQYPMVVDPIWTEQQELAAPDGAPNIYYGQSVAISGNTAVIGAESSMTTQGAAYVFVRSGGVWSFQQKLTQTGGVVYDYFGASVAIDGDTVVVGAPQATPAAYVFVRNGTTWSQQQMLTASDGFDIGCAVAVSGDTAVIGAVGNYAYVFVRNAGVWSQQQELYAPGMTTTGPGTAQFSLGVALSGNTAMVGNWGTNSEQGVVYVYTRSGTTWSQQQVLTASDGVAGDSFGLHLSLSGDTAVIGAPLKTIGSNIEQGAAYVFVSAGGAWNQQQELIASDGAELDGFGSSVSLSGDTMAVAANAVYEFVRANGVWTQQQEIPGVGSVSVSGNTTLIGIPATGGSQGTAYAFVRPRLGTDSLLLGSAGGTSSVVLSYDAVWTASANDSFLHISSGSASGTGSAAVLFTYDAFTGTGTRTGTLTIAGLTVTVTQAGANYIGPFGASPLITLAASGLNGPGGLAVDGSGNVYIADALSKTIKEWSPSTQQISTLVSSGLSDPVGIALDSSGNVYTADDSNNAIKEWNASSQQVTTLGVSGLLYPDGVAVDAFGDVYIADTGTNNEVKEWSPATQQVSVLVPYSLYGPSAVAVDVSGNVYFVENAEVKEWSAATQQVSPLVTSGLSAPASIAVDGSGNVYIADEGNSAVKQWSAATQQVATLASNMLYGPTGVAVDGFGNVYFSNEAENALYEIPYAFVGPAGLSEPAAAGTDSLLPVLPSTALLTGVFAPTSDQSWLTIGTAASGVVNFSFAANTSTSSRLAHIKILGQQINVTQNGTQNGTAAQTITFGALPSLAQTTAPFVVTATASSGLPVSFSSQTTSVCMMSGAIVELEALGTCTIQATQAGNANYAAASPVSQSFQVTAPGVGRIADVVFRNSVGSIELLTYPSSTPTNSGGLFASDPSAAQDLGGNTLVTARDNFNSIWANVYSPSISTWSGWQFGGGITQGVPSVAVDNRGTGWIASRDTYNSYWLVSYRAGTGFGSWMPLLGIFSTDPVVTACGDGSIYIIGKDNWNSLWSGHYVPGGGFQGWVFGGGIITGKPAATCGGDNAVYVVAEDSWNSNWMVRVSGNTWGTWYFGGAITSVTPRIAALGGGYEAVVILDSFGVVWSTIYTESTSNGWQWWAEVGGILQEVEPAVASGGFYLAGKAPNGDLWWWQQTGSYFQAGNDWTWIGNNGVAAGMLSAAPH